MKLHKVELRRLAETGTAVLWRPIEPQPQTVRLDTSANPPTWYDGIVEVGSPLRQWQMGDILATDSGPLRVVSVEVGEIFAVLSDETRWAWRVEVEVVGK